MEEPIIPNEVVRLQEPTAALTVCPDCDNAVVPGKIFCTNCGYPVNGTPEQKSNFDIEKYKLQAELDVTQSRIKNGTTTLYVLSGLALLGSFVIPTMMDMSGDEKKQTFITYIILSALYIGLAFLSKKKPFAALLTALILYVTVIILGAFVQPTSLFSGIIIKVLVIAYLVKGTKGAYEAEDLKRKLKIN